MATNSGSGYRHGAEKGRSQMQMANGNYMKRNAGTGQFMKGKASSGPYKGVRKEK